MTSGAIIAITRCISTFNRNNEPYYYYAFHKKRTERTCNKKNVRKESIEYEITIAIQRSMLTDETIEWMAGQVMEFQAENPEFTLSTYYREKLAEVQRTLANIIKTHRGRHLQRYHRQADARSGTGANHPPCEGQGGRSEAPEVHQEQVIETFEHYREGDTRNKEFQCRMILPVQVGKGRRAGARLPTKAQNQRFCGLALCARPAWLNQRFIQATANAAMGDSDKHNVYLDALAHNC